MDLANFNSSAEKNYKQSSITELGDSVTLSAQRPSDEVTLSDDQRQHSSNVAADSGLTCSSNTENNVAALGTASLGRAAQPPPSEKSSTLDAKDPKTMLIEDEEACGFVSPSAESKASAISAQLVIGGGRKRRFLEISSSSQQQLEVTPSAAATPISPPQDQNEATSDSPPLPPRDKTSMAPLLPEQSQGPPLPPREKTTPPLSTKSSKDSSSEPAPPLPPREKSRPSQPTSKPTVPPLPPRGEPASPKNALQGKAAQSPPKPLLLTPYKRAAQPPLEWPHLLKTTYPSEETDVKAPPVPPRSYEATPLHEPDDIEGPPLPPRRYEEVTPPPDLDGPQHLHEEGLLIYPNATFSTSIEEKHAGRRRASSPCPPLKEKSRDGIAPTGPPLNSVLLPVPLSPSHSSTPSLLQPQIFITAEEKCHTCPILKNLLRQPRRCEKCKVEIKPRRRSH